VNAVMNLQVSYNGGKLSSGYTTDGPSNSVQLQRVSKYSHLTCAFRDGEDYK
jgi:hypothetical protein